ncbi:MAG: aldo/keto reductase [Alphaproteobacteria bacterium]
MKSLDEQGAAIPIALGTAQLGIPYGLGAAASGLSAAEAEALLQAAWDSGIRCLDTAPGYGSAETRIGFWMRARGADPSVITKLPALGALSAADLLPAMRRSVDASRAALGLDVLDGVLLHKSADLLNPEAGAALLALRDEGAISAFGASVYTVEDARRALALPGLRLLQIPGSILNPTLLDAGIAADAKAAGVTLFVRSAFVQGLLLLVPGMLPLHLRAAAEPLGRLRELAKEANIGMAQLALSAVAAWPGVSSLVLGFDTPDQLREAVALLRRPPLDAELIEAAFRIGRSTPPEVADPRFWKAG